MYSAPTTSFSRPILRSKESRGSLQNWRKYMSRVKSWNSFKTYPCDDLLLASSETALYWKYTLAPFARWLLWKNIYSKPQVTKGQSKRIDFFPWVIDRKFQIIAWNCHVHSNGESSNLKFAVYATWRKIDVCLATPFKSDFVLNCQTDKYITTVISIVQILR